MARRRLLLALAVLAGLSLAAVLSLALLLPSEKARGREGASRGDASLIAAAKREPLPDISAGVLNPPPETLAVGNLRGRPVFISVWASWCVPCREEAPTMARLARQYRAQIEFVGIDIQDTRGAGRSFVRRFGLDYPHLFDPRASIARRLDVYGIPTALFVDREGRIAAILVGKQPEDKLDRYLRLLAGEARGA